MGAHQWFNFGFQRFSKRRNCIRIMLVAKGDSYIA
jgi:hypothetical protein